MAETRAINSAADLYDVLQASGLYDRVVMSTSGVVVTCYDAAGHPVLRTESSTDIMGYADADHAIPGTSLGRITHAYLCESGVILEKYYDGVLRVVYALTKTNTGEPALAVLDVVEEVWNAVTWGDEPPLNSKIMPVRKANQYALLPFVTNASYGINSYTPDAFYAAVTPGSQLPRSFVMHGTKWFAVSNIVLRDGTAG